MAICYAFQTPGSTTKHPILLHTSLFCYLRLLQFAFSLDLLTVCSFHEPFRFCRCL